MLTDWNWTCTPSFPSFAAFCQRASERAAICGHHDPDPDSDSDVLLMAHIHTRPRPYLFFFCELFLRLSFVCFCVWCGVSCRVARCRVVLGYGRACGTEWTILCASSFALRSDGVCVRPAVVCSAVRDGPARVELVEGAGSGRGRVSGGPAARMQLNASASDKYYYSARSTNTASLQGS